MQNVEPGIKERFLENGKNKLTQSRKGRGVILKANKFIH
jgi:hypothetical protein